MDGSFGTGVKEDASRNKRTNALLVVLAGMCVIAMPASGAEPIVLTTPSYSQDAQVAANIRAECDMPERLATNILRSAKERSLLITMESAQPGASGVKVLSLSFTDAMSRRSGGPGGHNKHVVVAGQLVVPGEGPLAFIARRKSSGGPGGWMKSACTVFDRINRSLADDIVGWLANPVDGAQLGDPP